MAHYTNYLNYLKNILNEDIAKVEFKNSAEYTQVLENTTKTAGNVYLSQIEKEFPEIPFEKIREFININDKYGCSIKTIFTTSKMKLLYCSPSCLRYSYHALLILKQMKEKNSNKIVELGPGYGGLFLAINMFAPLMNVELEKYYMVDLPEVTELIKKYLILHENQINCPLEIYDSDTFNEYIHEDNYMFVSNYCFTAINEFEQKKYTDTLIKSASTGFMVWQTCFGAKEHNIPSILNKTDIKTEEENPQTANIDNKNYYVTW